MKTKEQVSSSIQINSDAITSEVTRAKGQEAALSSKIEQTAKSITLSVENGTDSSTIKLTGNGITAQSRTIKFTGDVVFAADLVDGETTISGANITTGKIASKNGRVYFDLENNELACNKLVASGVWGNLPQAVVKVGTGVSTSSGTSSATYLGVVDFFVEGYEQNYLRISPSSDSYAGIRSKNGLKIGNDTDPDIIRIEDSFLRLYSPGDANTYIKAEGTDITLNGVLHGKLSRISNVSDFPYSLGLDTGGEFVRAASSSKRYKHHIGPVAEEGLDPHKLYGLPVCQYVFNEDYLAPGDQRQGQAVIGLIAEDVAEHYPAAAVYDGQGRVENWQERYIVPAMLALLQEQHREIEALKKRLEKLENAKEDRHG